MKNNTFGKRLKELREKCNWTIDALCSKMSNEYFVSIDEKSIRRYEKGEFLPKIDNLIYFSEVFNVSLDYLVFGKDVSDDKDLTWTASLKRLNRLLYTNVLMMWPKESADNFDTPGNVYFTIHDEEAQVYIDKLKSFFKNKNYHFEVRGEPIHIDLSEMDALLVDFCNYTESLAPSEARLNEVLKNHGDDPKTYLEQKLQQISRKRKPKHK